MPIEELATEVTGSVWKILIQIGDQVSEGDELVIIESMKMEIPVLAPADGSVKEILAKEGDVLDEGATVVLLEV